METYLPLFIQSKHPYSIYYRSHPNKSATAVFVCCLEKALKQSRVKKWFLNCGKIKSIEVGEMEKDSKTIYYAILEFKHRQSLRRSLDNDWLQQQIDLNSEQKKGGKPINHQVESHINKMEEDGFTMVLPKKSKVNKFDYIPPTLDYTPGKRQRSENDFYNFQVKRKSSLKKMKDESS